MTLRFVITGCAGSGTGWAYRVMHALNVNCGHQGVYATTGVQRRHRLNADSSWCAVPHIDSSTPTLFLQRNPLDIVRSIDQLQPVFDAESSDHSLGYVQRYRPDIADLPDRLSRILMFAGTWGEEIEAHANVRTLRIEEANTASVARAFRYLTGKDIRWRYVREALASVGSSFNSHNGSMSQLSWSDIEDHPLGHHVITRAEKWGYR